jgi:hypothetical protein
VLLQDQVVDEDDSDGGDRHRVEQEVARHPAAA